MDKDTQIDADEEEKDSTLEGNEAVGWHGIGRSPEHETLLGIYQCVYSTNREVREIANFINRIDWYLELLYYGVVGALIGWAMVQIFKLFGLW